MKIVLAFSPIMIISILIGEAAENLSSIEMELLVSSG